MDEVAKPDPGPPDEGLKTPVSDLIHFLGKPHMHAVIFHAVAGRDKPIRYHELMERSGVPRNTLVNRLREAVGAGLLERIDHQENPPRVEYKATPAMFAMVPVFRAMHEWCRDWGLAGEGE